MVFANTQFQSYIRGGCEMTSAGEWACSKGEVE